MRFLGKVTFALPIFFAVVSGALAQDIKVTLLGTGSPPPVMNRFGPSILVEAGDKKFLFDEGRCSDWPKSRQNGKTWMESFLRIFTPTM